MSLVKINWKPTPVELRKFGVAMILGFGLIGILMQFKLHHDLSAYVCYGFGAVAGLLGLTGKPIALPVYWAWMGLAFVMGNIMSRVLLAIVFYGVLTPIGLLRRLVGVDTLKRKKPTTSSYWTDFSESQSKDHYEHQF